MAEKETTAPDQAAKRTDVPEGVSRTQPSDTTAADDARENAEFGAGFEGDRAREGGDKAKPADKPDKPDLAATPREKVVEPSAGVSSIK
jgi:hypothetical protein